ncbi:MAG: hypothetical protein ACF8AM_00790 [Rhodopirellula sp. JB055]|uniref:hypothetical protein n=1 Tax=Rhodopirellula sp. JB055 TaxID=3342846 RepID=UPI00370AAC45
MAKKRNIPKRRKPTVTGEQHDLIRVVVIDEDGNEKEQLVTQAELSEIKRPTEHLHQELEPEDEAVARFTFREVGRLIQPTYEQWENGFLRERDPQKELGFWLLIAAFVQARGYDDKERFAIAGDVCSGNTSPKLGREINKFVEQLDVEAFLAEIAEGQQDEP